MAVPVRKLDSSPERCCVVPLPAKEKFILPGRGQTGAIDHEGGR